jgi:hypothetical protein
MYQLGFCIPEDNILHGRRREKLKLEINSRKHWPV